MWSPIFFLIDLCPISRSLTTINEVFNYLLFISIIKKKEQNISSTISIITIILKSNKCTKPSEIDPNPDPNPKPDPILILNLPLLSTDASYLRHILFFNPPSRLFKSVFSRSIKTSSVQILNTFSFISLHV
jgi:hypothetical protein